MIESDQVLLNKIELLQVYFRYPYCSYTDDFID